MPPKKEAKLLKPIINDLSNKFSGPVFEPHITIISGFKGNEKLLLNKAECFSKLIKPFYVSFKELDTSNHFFCSLYISIIKNLEIESARILAEKVFDIQMVDYMPHMSLAYGDYSKDKKNEMIGTINSTPDGFFVDQIYLAYNDEINLKWKIIDNFSLNK
jgi:2'-5' RNA ligase